MRLKDEDSILPSLSKANPVHTCMRETKVPMSSKQGNLNSSERRASPRAPGPIPAVALDLTGSAERTGIEIKLENLSAGGFYAFLPHLIDKIFVVARISQALVAIRGAVVRVDQESDKQYGHAFVIHQYQIFSSKDDGTTQVAPKISLYRDTPPNESEKHR